jgi:hypothetical protein
MIHLFLLVLGFAGVARMARTRGRSGVLFGALAVSAFVGLPLAFAVLTAYLPREWFATAGSVIGAEVVVNLLPYVGLGAVALWVRYVPGREKPQPIRSWNCRNCGWLNGNYALQCDACKTAYSELPHP